jgi:hypothetical protein
MGLLLLGAAIFVVIVVAILMAVAMSGRRGGSDRP